MTGNLMKPREIRLDSCVLSQPKGVKIGEKLGDTACNVRKIIVLAGVANGMLENTGGNRQDRYNTKLLGKYRMTQPDPSRPHITALHLQEGVSVSIDMRIHGQQPNG